MELLSRAALKTQIFSAITGKLHLRSFNSIPLQNSVESFEAHKSQFSVLILMLTFSIFGQQLKGSSQVIVPVALQLLREEHPEVSVLLAAYRQGRNG